ncbi:MAG: Pantoate--beta-alanine ligase, partial [uncultured Solirubrobacteraceae bacterium]
YLALVDPETFSPLDAVNGSALVAVAARVGDVRLIDNLLLPTPTKDRREP